MKNLRIGSRGNEVLEVQKILGLKQDAVFGKLTDQYVRNFQKKTGIIVDGIVGPATLALLRGWGELGLVTHVETTLAGSGKFQLSERSLSRLKGVHPDLVRVVKRAIYITSVDFMIIEGVRTMSQQIIYVRTGKSKTLKGRHIPENNACKMSCAVDLGAMVGGVLVWDWKYYIELSRAMKQAAKELSIPLEWGGDWKSLRDGPHFQLPWSVYK